MKVVCLGGAGAMASSCAYDLHKTSDFDEIVIADFDEGKARQVIDLMDGDKRFSYVKLDASKKDEIVKVLKDADYVVDGLPYKYVYNFMDAVKEVGINGVSLNMGEDLDKAVYYSSALEKMGKTMLIGNGGCATTCEIAMLGCEEMDEIDDINLYWGMWRPITHSTVGLADTVVGEYDPRSDARVYWEKGKIIRNLPPFALAKEFEFPEPIGKQEPHIIMHWEPATLPLVPIIKEKRVKRIVVRGIWHYGWTRLIRTLLENGIFEAEPVVINGVEVSPFEVVMEHIKRQSAEKWEDPYELAEKLGFNPQCILSVEITGYKNGMGKRTVYHSQLPYPFFDGKPVTASMEYGTYVGVACSVSLQMLQHGEISKKGAVTIETTSVPPKKYLDEYGKRGAKLTRQKFLRDGDIMRDKPSIPKSMREYRHWSLQP
ncbi:MAG: saccharopine dehydrogenase NADP-binding domain-containing protein [Dehalococcoidia bacterium]|nr:saccharopine dehydrogenase NADP-binding domain-containing protein [Dehalococcoidia bacterium]